MDNFRTGIKVILKGKATDWLMPTALVTVVSELLIVRSPEVIVTMMAIGNTRRR